MSLWPLPEAIYCVPEDDTWVVIVTSGSSDSKIKSNGVVTDHDGPFIVMTFSGLGVPW